MISKQEAWGIVLVGHWNRMIFSPEWVGEHLFHQDEVEAQIALMPIFPVIYRHEKVVFEVSSGRLTFRPRFDSTDSLEAAEHMAVKVLDDLPDTPLIGVGVNFSFTEQNPPPRMLDLFNFSDRTQTARAGWETLETKVERKLTNTNDNLLLSLSQDDDGVGIDFNFHKDTRGASRAINAVARAAVFERVVTLRGAAVEFCREIYQLQIEEG